MHRRIGLALVVLVSLPAAFGRAEDDFPPLLSQQPSLLNTPLEELSWDTIGSSAPRTTSQGDVIQSGYHVPPAAAADCAPQPFPAPARPCPPPECPPHAYQPQAAPPQQYQPQAIPPQFVQPQAAPGMFAAPQARGEISGESSSLGIRGFGIRIPAIHLEFPTVQLPSLIRFRREPEMRVDAAYAPFVAGAPAVYGQLVPGGIAHVAPPVPAPLPAYPQGQMVLPQKEPCPVPGAPSAQGPTCDPQSLQQELAEREQVIRELEAKLQRFQALEQSLQQLSQQHQQLRQELQRPGTLPACPPGAGRAESTNPRIPAPAPTTPPQAPPAQDERDKSLFNLFD